VALRRWVTGIVAMPEASPLPPVAMTWRLAWFLALIWAVAVAGLIPALGQKPNWPGALFAGALVAMLAVWSVPLAARIQGRWSASVFVALAFAFTVGPLAIVTMSVGYVCVFHVRRRTGLVRSAFNLANHILRNLAAWAAYSGLAGPEPSMARAIGAGVAGGVVELAVGTGLLGVVLGIATQDFRPRELIRAVRQLLYWNVAFGFAAGGVAVLYRIGGSLGLLVLLVPVVMLQMSLVATARRMHAEAEKDAAHARERERLLRREAQALRRAGDASEVERKRIAADLHDSVIQDMSGLLFRSSAMLGRLSDGDASVWTREGVEGYLTYTHDLAAEAVRELRTLMVELAPPLLDQEGLASALRQLLSRLDREHIAWSLECSEERLDQRHQRLVYRVVQEALRNVIQHAQCHTVWVTVRVDGDRLLASIRDDGRGFSAAERAERRKKGHAGLGLLVQTARDGGGEVSITSHPGRGTRVELSAPMLPAPLMDEAAPDKQTGIPADGAIVVGDELSGDLGAHGPRAEQPAAPAAIGRAVRSRKPPEHASVTSSRVP
jgi:signal transduction histidine kinase